MTENISKKGAYFDKKMGKKKSKETTQQAGGEGGECAQMGSLLGTEGSHRTQHCLAEAGLTKTLVDRNIRGTLKGRSLPLFLICK